MNKTKVLTLLACMGLLITACNAPKPAPSSEPSSEPSSQPSSEPSSEPSGESSEAPHEHNYQLVGSAVKNSDNKDVFHKKCAADNDQYIGIAFDDYSFKGADFGSTSSYTGVPEEIRADARLLTKNSVVSWRISVSKAISNAELRFGVTYTGGDHGSKGGLDGTTVKYSVKVNEGDYENWAVGETDTYDGVGITQKARNYVKFANVNLVAGENVITLRQNNAGYRLLFGGEVRVYFTGDATVAAAPAGHTVTFATQHASVKVYPLGADYTVSPVAATTAKATVKGGGVANYAEADEATGAAEVKPQVNFVIELEQGYGFDDGIDHTFTHMEGDPENIKESPEVKANKISWVTPTANFNKAKIIEYTDGNKVTLIYRLTKVKGDVTVNINAVQPAAQPTGEFHGMVKLADNSFSPIDMKVEAAAVTLSIDGEAIQVTSYEWDGIKNTISVVTASQVYGTLTASYANNVFTVTGVSGPAKDGLAADYVAQISGNCQFIDCGALTLDQMNAYFVRRYDRNDGNGWQINNPSDGRISKVNKEGRDGLQCNGFESGKVGFTLKNDLPQPIPGTVIKSLGCWIYNPGQSSFSMTLFAYKSANRATNGQLNTFTIQPGWHFYQTGVVNGSSFTANDSFYNFQFYYSGVSVNPVFDDLCIYM